MPSVRLPIRNSRWWADRYVCEDFCKSSIGAGSEVYVQRSWECSKWRDGMLALVIARKVAMELRRA